MEQQLKNYISLISPPDAEAAALAKARQNSLAKPPGSLGKLDGIAAKATYSKA